MNAPLYVRPDWVITGVPLPGGGVRLIASTDLRVASVQERQERWFDGSNPDNLLQGFDPAGWVYDLKVTMKGYTLVEAADYPTALTMLFNRWNPEASQPPTPPRQPRALTAGPTPEQADAVTYLDSFAPGGHWYSDDARKVFESAYDVARNQGLPAEAAEAVLRNVIAAVEHEMNDVRHGA